MEKCGIINIDVDVNGKLDPGAVPGASTISILGCVYVGAKLRIDRCTSLRKSKCKR